MYNLTDLLGKVVTIKSHKGDEFVATLLGIDTTNTILTVKRPKIVVIDQNSVALIPFALTAHADTVYLHVNQIFTVMESLPGAAEDYLALIADEDLEIAEEMADEMASDLQDLS